MGTQIVGKGQGQIQNNSLEQNVKNPYQKNTIPMAAGRSAITMQAGYIYPAMYKEVLAGEYIEEWKVDNLTRIITPLVPTMDKVYINIKAHFVPHQRVWTDATTALASKSSKENTNKNLVYLPYGTLEAKYTEHQRYKETLAARYGNTNKTSDTSISLLVLRGYRAIINDYVINKAYELPKVEWNTSIITQAEQNALNAYAISGTKPNDKAGDYHEQAYIVEKAQTRKSYYTDIRPQIAGTDELLLDDYENQADHLDWQNRFNKAKQDQLNAEKNDWDIIADMGGTSALTADRTQFLGEIDYELNYQQITQSSPEADNSSPLGTTGSFSYTRASGTLFQHFQAKQHGFIHITVSIGMDKLLEDMTPLELLKRQVEEIYTPALANKEVALMKLKELTNNSLSVQGSTVGYKKPYSEYSRLPNFITGEMRSRTLNKNNDTEIGNPVSVAHWHNFQEHYSTGTIDGKYFRPAQEVIATMARNSVQVFEENEQDTLYNDNIMNMSEHSVKVSSPITENVISGKQIATMNR